MQTPRTLLLVAAGAVLLAACSSGTAGDTTTTTPPEVSSSTAAPSGSVPGDYAGFRAQSTACGAEAPTEVTPMQFDFPGEADVADAVSVTLLTSCGPIEITLNPGFAEETVNSFIFLAESGYFNGSASHRIIPGFMVQAGDPTATGRGGPGYTIPDELPVDGFVYDIGVVAMANAGPGTSGSQFFIMLDEASWLPPSYSVFGYVTGGFETLELIEGLPLGMNPNGGDQSPSTPLESLYIESVVVSR